MKVFLSFYLSSDLLISLQFSIVIFFKAEIFAKLVPDNSNLISKRLYDKGQKSYPLILAPFLFHFSLLPILLLFFSLRSI